MLQCLMQQDGHLPDCGLGLTSVFVVESLDRVRADFLQPHLAKVRDDMVIQQIAVRCPRRMPQFRQLLVR